MFFKELWQINPIKVFFDTTQAIPGLSSNSKIVVFLKNVSPVLYRKISKNRDYILNLELGSKNEELYLHGDVDPGSLWIAKWLRIRLIHFQARLKIMEIEGNVVRFRLSSYELNNPNQNRWDILRYLSWFDRILKRKILKTITAGFPHVLRLAPIKDEIYFNLNYFLDPIPSLAGKIFVVSADLQNDRVIFHARSNVILKPLMDLLGPQYVKVTYREAGKYY